MARFLTLPQDPERRAAEVDRMRGRDWSIRRMQEARKRADRKEALERASDRAVPGISEPSGAPKRRDFGLDLGAALAGPVMSALGGLGGLRVAQAGTKVAPAVGRMLAEGSTHPAALATGAGIGAGMELLEDDPTALGALANAGLLATGTAFPIPAMLGEALTYSPNAEAGIGRLLSKFGRSALSEALPDRPSVEAPRGALGVVKNKGGNWLGGSVEDALKGLKRENPLTRRVAESVGLDEEAFLALPKEQRALAARAVAGPDFTINQWIEGPLTKYVKTRMASPEDEVRKLAEQGVLHFEPIQHGGQTPRTYATRQKLGYPPLGVSGTPLGRRWEDAADFAVTPLPASHYQSSYVGQEENPWIMKLDPNASIYDIPPRGPVFENLGFPHLIDELSNALNPASGLPRHLQLSPEAMQNLSMEKAVRRVSDINAWRAAQKAEANRKLAEQASLVREYADESIPNPKGLRWMELKAPDRWPEGADTQQMLTEHGDLGRYSRKLLRDQLKYEGEVMQNCVGGYCPDVLEGRKRIFSLRDAKGEPHVTIEEQPGNWFREITNRSMDDSNKFNAELKRRLAEAGESAGTNPKLEDSLGNALYAEMFGQEPRSRIVQIKGKQNRKPKDEYLPFVQDFVRNSPLGGSWSDVGDFGNTGLHRRTDLTSTHPTKLGLPPELYDPSAISPRGLEELLPEYFTPDELVAAAKKLRGFAQGGLVDASLTDQMIDRNLDAVTAARNNVPRRFANGGIISKPHPMKARIERLMEGLKNG